MWDEITYPFPNFNSATAAVFEWRSNFIPRFLYMLLHAGIKAGLWSPYLKKSRSLETCDGVFIFSYNSVYLQMCVRVCVCEVLTEFRNAVAMPACLSIFIFPWAARCFAIKRNLLKNIRIHYWIIEPSNTTLIIIGQYMNAHTTRNDVVAIISLYNKDENLFHGKQCTNVNTLHQSRK